MKHLLSLLSRTVQLAAAGFLLLTAPALTLRADAVFAWNEALLHFSTSAAGAMPFPLEARAYAITHLAVLEALDALPADLADDDRTARRAAVVTAAHDVLLALLPAGTAMFDALAARHLDALPDGAGKTQGRATGAAAAARVLQARSADGWEQAVRGGREPGRSGIDEADLARGVAPALSPWLDPRPFALKSADQFEVEELRRVRMNGEVTVNHRLGASRLFEGLDREAAFAAREAFWAQSPLVAWNRIARQACAGRPTDLRDQARVLARLNVALADAALAGAHARHVVGNWRAVVAEVWQPVDARLALATDVVARIDDGTHHEAVRLEYGRVFVPPVAHYPAVGATLAGAAQAVLGAYFGRDRLAFALPVGAEGRTFPGFSAAAREHAFVTSLDGVHSREGCVAGYELGASIGRYAARRALIAQR
ncbi:MAG: hypothetical protein JNL92_11565 [Opitutaceae bacterium]|nr:hypothetical protein [Opitutaceae bacterium]